MSTAKQRAQALHALLMARFPRAFPKDYDALLPLKLDIESDIRTRLAEQGEPVDPDLLRRVLANHTGRAGYLLALLHKQMCIRDSASGTRPDPSRIPTTASSRCRMKNPARAANRCGIGLRREGLPTDEKNEGTNRLVRDFMESSPNSQHPPAPHSMSLWPMA